MSNRRSLSNIGFATSNIGKLKEAQQILGLAISQINFSFTEPQEVRGEEIAAAKARSAFLQFKEPVFADHTSLYIEALNNLPGGLTGTIIRQVGDIGILQMLKGCDNRKAIGQTVVAFCDSPSPMIFTGEIHGTIVTTAIGREHTGWDRIFIPDGFSKTYGEMSIEEKNAISQRRVALEKFKNYLIEHYDFKILK